jgi:hypothetical protein
MPRNKLKFELPYFRRLSGHRLKPALSEIDQLIPDDGLLQHCYSQPMSGALIWICSSHLLLLLS